MKKVSIILIALLLVLTCFVGCNKQIFDINYKFNYAIISCGDSVLTEGPIKSWTDYDDCDMVQVTFTDGTVYYTHGSNVVLICGD